MKFVEKLLNHNDVANAAGRDETSTIPSTMPKISNYNLSYGILPFPHISLDRPSRHCESPQSNQEDASEYEDEAPSAQRVQYHGAERDT